MNALAQLRGRLVPGARIECVQNTFLPERAKERYIVTDAPHGAAKIAGIFGTDRYGQITVPTQADQVTWVDDETVSWPLIGRFPHTVTYRFIDREGKPFPPRTALVP